MTLHAPFTRPRHLLEREPVDTVEQLFLHEIDTDQWRVLDTRLPADDVRALLGFVGRDGDDVGVTLIDEPGRVHHCTTLEDARLLFLTDPMAPAAPEGLWVQRARHYHSL